MLVTAGSLVPKETFVAAEGLGWTLRLGLLLAKLGSQETASALQI